MTKSTITRERLEEIILDNSASLEEFMAITRMALAAMDSEPVACGNGCSKSKWHKMALDIDEYMNGEDARESKGRDEIYSEIILRLTRLDVLETILRNEIGLPYGSPIPDIAEKIYDIKRARIYSVVPEDARQALRKMVDEIIAELDAEESACRAAMLQAEPVTTANKLGNSPVIPDAWIPVSEQMPEDGQHIIIFCDGAFVLFAQCRDGEFFDIVRDREEFFETTSRCVTHWMPLPNPPKEEK